MPEICACVCEFITFYVCLSVWRAVCLSVLAARDDRR